MADTPDAPRAEGIGAQLKNVKPWQWAVAGGIGIAVIGYILKKKMNTSSGTVQLTPNPSGNPIVVGSGGGGDGGSGGGGGNPPPTPPPTPTPPTPTPPSNPQYYLPFDPSSLHPNTGPFYSSFTEGDGGPGSVSGYETYYTYDTPTGGAPTQSNPASYMAGWTQAQWEQYNNQIANEWGIDPSKTGILTK